MKYQLIFFVVLLFVLQVSTVRAYGFVNDSANILRNDIQLHQELNDFFNKYNVKLYLETVTASSDIQKLAKSEFFRIKLNKEGMPELNMLVLYSKRENKLTIAHSERCNLNAQELLGIVRDKLVKQSISQRDFDKAFARLLDLLTKAINTQIDSKPICIPREEFLLKELIQNMTLEEKIGQMLVIPLDLTQQDTL